MPLALYIGIGWQAGPQNSRPWMAVRSRCFPVVRRCWGSGVWKIFVGPPLRPLGPRVLQAATLFCVGSHENVIRHMQA